MKNSLLTFAVLFPFAVGLAEAQGQARRAAPMAVKPFRGKYCAAFAPPGWFVYAENAQRVAFGADTSSADQKAFASYAVFGGGTLTAVPGAETPERAVAKSLTNMGTVPTRFGNKQQLGPNVFLIEFQNNVSHGIAFYQVFPSGRGGFVIVMREATTPIAVWPQRGAEASAVARSLRCHVPNVPPAPDPPGLTRKPRTASSSSEKEGDTLYNQWLDKEYYHNSATGENFWVSPSHDWEQNGPQGPGYYAPQGNTIVKLDPGYQ